MVWPAPKTWSAGDSWPIGDANTYVRDAMTSVRRYQNSPNAAIGSATGITGAIAAKGSNNTGLVTSTPDEAYRMIVILSGLFTNPSGTMSAYAGIKDSTGSYMSTWSGPFTTYAIPSSSSAVSFTVMGVATYAAGISPSWQFWSGCSTGTIDAYWMGCYFFAPVT